MECIPFLVIKYFMKDHYFPTNSKNVNLFTYNFYLVKYLLFYIN